MPDETGTKLPKVRLVIDYDLADHSIHVTGQGGNYNTSVAMLQQALAYYDNLRMEAVIGKAVVDALQVISDRRKVGQIFKGDA